MKEKPIIIQDTLYPKKLRHAKKFKGKIDKNTLHRAKASERALDIQKLRDDIRNKDLFEDMNENTDRLLLKGYKLQGEYRKKKELKQKMVRRSWMCLWVFIGLVALYSLINQ